MIRAGTLVSRADAAFTAADAFVALLVAALSAGARLWMLSHPEHVSFDEVHFGNFTTWYVNREFHFDIHPPLGKLLMASLASLGQFRGGIAAFQRIGSEYRVSESQYVLLRSIPAVFSSFCAPLLYCAGRCLGLDPLPCATAAAIVALDSSLIVEGKFILSDGMLHFFSALHFFTFCLFLRHESHALAALAGATLGAASMCKFTALGLFAVDGVTQLLWIALRWPAPAEVFLRACAFLLPALLTAFLAWVWHFAATPFSGYHASYIAREDAHTIIDRAMVNVSYWGDRLLDSPLLRRIVTWNHIMNQINMRSKIPHPWESRPQYWPLLLDRYVLFWAKDARRVHCLGLPAVYWFTSAGIALTVPAFAFRRAGWQNALLLWSWAVSYLPFLRIPRTMFHYHYLVPLMFAALNLGALIHHAVKNPVVRGAVASTIIALTVLCFAFFAPWIYAYDCPQCDKTRHWLYAWTHGPPKPVNCFGKELFNTTAKFVKIPM
jgi:dolichyl-phosphate-mannose-protein mannosyltransferase